MWDRVPEECPNEVAALIMQCLSPDPKARPTSTQIFRTLQRVAGLTPAPSLGLTSTGSTSLRPLLGRSPSGITGTLPSGVLIMPGEPGATPLRRNISSGPLPHGLPASPEDPNELSSVAGPARSGPRDGPASSSSGNANVQQAATGQGTTAGVNVGPWSRSVAPVRTRRQGSGDCGEAAFPLSILSSPSSVDAADAGALSLEEPAGTDAGAASVISRWPLQHPWGSEQSRAGLSPLAGRRGDLQPDGPSHLHQLSWDDAPGLLPALEPYTTDWPFADPVPANSQPGAGHATGAASARPYPANPLDGSTQVSPRLASAACTTNHPSGSYEPTSRRSCDGEFPVAPISGFALHTGGATPERPHWCGSGSAFGASSSSTNAACASERQAGLSVPLQHAAILQH